MINFYRKFIEAVQAQTKLNEAVKGPQAKGKKPVE